MNDKRLIEDFLPIQNIGEEASKEKSIRKGHISTLHLWWARRPLVACRAAIYATLVPAPSTKNGRGPKSDFLKRLCKYPGDPKEIKTAIEHIYEIHAKRLSQELGKEITVKDIKEGKAPKPKILDMFAGGGSIPLEALRLGCDAYALELNPVAHIIELATLVYPQKYGKPDKTKRGCSEDGTWAGLAKEVEYWGKWMIEKVKEEIGDLYPVIRKGPFIKQEEQIELEGFPKRPKQKILKFEEVLIPVAYLWTRTVKCKNPNCQATVPLLRQTWLCKKKNRFIALKVEPDTKTKKPKFTVVSSNKNTEKEAIEEFGFNPSNFSKGGNAECIFCRTICDSDYVKAEGRAKRIGRQLMAVVCVRKGYRGKIYLAPNEIPEDFIPDDEEIWQRIEKLCKEMGLTVPEEPLPHFKDDENYQRGTLGFGVQPYGITKWKDLFIPRQLLCLLTFVKFIKIAFKELLAKKYNVELAKVVISFLGFCLDRLADFNSTGCVFNVTGGRGVVHTFGRQAIPITWDFAETNPFNPIGASWPTGIKAICEGIESIDLDSSASVIRGSATQLPYDKEFFDAVITDPPYYDNVPYADLSDFFYVWLKRSIGFLYPEHFSSELTPKKKEIVADSKRYENSKEKAKQAYEEMMFKAFKEAHRVLKPNAPLVVIYAHKTTAGWSTLVEALRKAGFVITEAWPLETERPGRLRDIGSSALASSIFLVARKREEKRIGSYENDVYPELEKIIRERVDTLWKWKITGADLLIASVGAGLKAYTQFDKVELANGEEVKSDKFLQDVEGLVQEFIDEKLYGVSRKGLSQIDVITRFYVRWRSIYGKAEVDAGEAIVFAYPWRIELDGPRGLSSGRNPLLDKKKGKYRLRDFTERGNDKKLGLPEDKEKAPLIDVLHRILYLLENNPRKIDNFLLSATPDTERLRLVVQALVGIKFSDKQSIITTTEDEHRALSKLLTNWKNIIEQKTLELFKK